MFYITLKGDGISTASSKRESSSQTQNLMLRRESEHSDLAHARDIHSTSAKYQVSVDSVVWYGATAQGFFYPDHQRIVRLLEYY